MERAPMSNEQITSPTALPRESWTGTLKRTASEFREDKLNHWGAALTYYAVLSLFPAVLVLVSLVGLFADPARVTRVITDTVAQLGPDSAAKTFQGPINSITAHRGTAGVMFAVGVLSALWAASGYVSAFADACNTIYEVDEGRPFWRRKPLQLAVTLVIILLAALVVLGLILSGPIVSALGSALGVSDTVLTIWRFAKWPAMLALVLVIFGGQDYTGPNARVTVRALGDRRRGAGACRLAARLDRPGDLRLELRVLQQDVRGARGRRRLPHVAVGHEHGHPAGRRVQRRDGARPPARRRRARRAGAPAPRGARAGLAAATAEDGMSCPAGRAAHPRDGRRRPGARPGRHCIAAAGASGPRA